MESGWADFTRRFSKWSYFFPRCPNWQAYLLQEAGVSAKARSLDASVSLFNSQAFDETIRRIALYSNLYKQNSE